MSELWDGLMEAFYLLFSGDPELWNIIFLSLRVSGTAVLFASFFALPLGSYIGISQFKGKKFISNLINTFMGFPPVVMGLILYLLLSKSGPLGSLNLLYTSVAMILAQLFLAFPIILGTTKAAIETLSTDIKETILSFGANRYQFWWRCIIEARKSIIAGILVAFGQAISEVGAVMIVGGNIRWQTRVFTTAIVLNTRMGEFGMAIALGIVLLIISFAINYIMTHLQFSNRVI
ncbi:MAG: ABC transporter permease [Promethearchaeota archaeon]